MEPTQSSTINMPDGSKSVETHDSSGRLIEVADYESDGALRLKITYRYDDRDNNIERLVTGEDGQQIRLLRFIYDRQNRNTAHDEFNSKNELEFRLEYEYDGDKKVRLRVFDKNGKMIRESSDKMDLL